MGRMGRWILWSRWRTSSITGQKSKNEPPRPFQDVIWAIIRQQLSQTNSPGYTLSCSCYALASDMHRTDGGRALLFFWRKLPAWRWSPSSALYYCWRRTLTAITNSSLANACWIWPENTNSCRMKYIERSDTLQRMPSCTRSWPTTLPVKKGAIHRGLGGRSPVLRLYGALHHGAGLKGRQSTKELDQLYASTAS